MEREISDVRGDAGRTEVFFVPIPLSGLAHKHPVVAQAAYLAVLGQ